MALTRGKAFLTAPPSEIGGQLVPVVTVMLGSLTVLLPMIATFPLMPSMGLVMLLGWRLPRAGLWPAWTALPLGLFDDLFSGQPLGSAMALWTVTLLAIDYCDLRLLWRGHWQDWGLAALAIAGVTLGAWGLVQLTGGATPIILL